MMKDKIIQLSNGIIISYLDNENHGKKKIVFAHGWGADKYNLQAIYNNLLHEFHIISIDIPGFGKSSMPKLNADSIDYSEYLFEFFNFINFKDINYVGHSFGGKIGIILSANYPQLIKRLVLIDSSGIRSKKNISWYIQVYTYKFLKFIFIYLLKNKNKISQLQKQFGSEDYKTSGSMRNIFMNVINEDYSDVLKKIDCPVFLYWGKKDKDTPLWMAKKMLKSIKDCALYTVKNGGHYSFLQDNKIISIIKSFTV